MAAKEATARIKINKLLEAAGWRFFTTETGPANIKLEPNVTIKTIDLDALGEDFEKTSKGFIDFLLSIPKAFRSSSLRPNRRTRAHSLERNRHVSMHGPKTAASSFCRTVTSTTSGIWSAAIPTSLRHFLSRIRQSTTRRSPPIPSVSLKRR